MNVKTITKKKRHFVPLHHEELLRLEKRLHAIACSPSWVDAILDALARRRVAYVTDSEGRLKTRLADLFLAIAEAGIYPPAADDSPKFAAGNSPEGVVEFHLGAQMRPCLSASCTRSDEKAGTLSVLYPVEYAKHGICYACHINQTPLDAMAAELGFTVSALASATAIAARQSHYYGIRIKHQRTRQGRYPRLKETPHDLTYAGIASKRKHSAAQAKTVGEGSAAR